MGRLPLRLPMHKNRVRLQNLPTFAYIGINRCEICKSLRRITMPRKFPSLSLRGVFRRRRSPHNVARLTIFTCIHARGDAHPSTWHRQTGTLTHPRTLRESESERKMEREEGTEGGRGVPWKLWGGKGGGAGDRDTGCQGSPGLTSQVWRR